MTFMPSKERGCDGKMKISGNYTQKANDMSKKHGKSYGVYNCPHCHGMHLTTKIEKADQYPDLLYVSSKTDHQP